MRPLGWDSLHGAPMKELPAIYSDGTGYIPTDIEIGQGFGFECKFSADFDAFPYDCNNTAVFGAVKSANGYPLWCQDTWSIATWFRRWESPIETRLYVGIAGRAFWPTKHLSSGTHVVKVQNIPATAAYSMNIVVNGETISSSYDSANTPRGLPTGLPIYILGFNIIGTAIKPEEYQTYSPEGDYITFSYLRIDDGNSIVHDLVPVDYRGQIMILDKITGRTYASVGNIFPKTT